MTGADVAGADLEKTELLIRRLIGWYGKNKRELPWRKDRNPYHVWVSEIMLQQTRVEAVKPYYERFLEALPDPASLAACPEDRLMKLWEGLGYYSRVRNMQKAARQIESEYGGRMPDTFEELLHLAGIGRYTAGAIASIAFGRPEPAVDGNALRVFTRLSGDDRDIMKQSVRREIEDHLRAGLADYFSNCGRNCVHTENSRASAEPVPLTAGTRPCSSAQGIDAGTFNQAVMDLGAGICLPGGQPHCAICPVQDLCMAHQTGRETVFPVKARKKDRRVEEKTILLIRDGSQVLIEKRPETGLLAGLYGLPELPGTADEAAALSYVKKLGLAPLHIRALRAAKHIFTHVEWHMTGYEIRVGDFGSLPEGEKSGNGFLVEIDRIRKDYAIPSAYRAYTEYLR